MAVWTGTGGQTLEVLAPAGDRERLEAALLFGADAVYLSGSQYGMRTACSNFSTEELRRAVETVHAQDKRVYITCNILPRNAELDALPAYLEQLDALRVDALIVADLGVMELATRYAPRCALHVSTQLGVVNYQTARVLREMGARRVVLARELSMEEIAEIRAKTPADLELEAFVHGAMCMSYSGRCLLSNYLTGRDGNHGDCAQPCRWKYQLLEPNRPGQPLTVEETEEGTYLFNANDLNMIEHIPELAAAGVSSLKIEGRAKAAYYTAVVTHAYRQAVDGYRASGCSPNYRPADWVKEEVEKVSHRPYGTGFYFGSPAQNTKAGGYIRQYEVVAVVTGWQDGRLILSQRNPFRTGDRLEIVSPGQPPVEWTVTHMWNEEGESVEAAPHPTMLLTVPFDHPLVPGTFFRRRKTAEPV